ncbi:hypothetical protein QJS10_CPB13g00515 [Acorus calamus]|uniref:DCL protein n=1 Tax=Acorus calamus TaxID=4465 RepID=A0AAV9DHP2_ACOCL|nr:hypothetical protein QJS10_CPB13g00515 [Acorus calamus]
MAGLYVLRGGVSLLRLRIQHSIAPYRSSSSLGRRLCTAAITGPPHLQETSTTSSPSEAIPRAPPSLPSPPPPSPLPSQSWSQGPNYRRWKEAEAEILEDVEPIILFVKDILHSERYLDGARLTSEDEKQVVEKLLSHHPHSNDKIGCGLDSIMVDRHPQFKTSRCLFVVRSDGGWIDFSYQKCLRAYIRDKYPSYAERFIRAHFKRS